VVEYLNIIEQLKLFLLDNVVLLCYHEAMKKEDVKALRKKLGLTQSQFAEKMGVTLQAVQHWEQGRRAVAGAAEKLMECLGRKGS